MVLSIAALASESETPVGRLKTSGDGSELRQPLGITIVGGLVMSQLLTLYTTPVVYLFFDRLRLRFARKGKGQPLLND